jgi:hypothetical protein
MDEVVFNLDEIEKALKGKHFIMRNTRAEFS